MKKGEHLSEEHKQKISIAHRRENLSEETRNKMSEAKKGKLISEETKKKISEALKGRDNHKIGTHWSEEQRKKMADYRSKTNVWIGRNHTKESIKKMSQSQKNWINQNGHPFLGKHHSEETKQKIREARSKQIMPSRPCAEETKRKLSKMFKGRCVSMETRKKMSDAGKKRMLNEELRNKLAKLGIGNHQSEENRKKASERMKETRKHIIFPVKDTRIEVKIQNYLKELKIDFFTHQYIEDIEHGYQCDILIPAMDLIIECDGDYFHKYPVGRDIDRIRTSELITKGFKVLRLWECEIKVMSIDDFKIRLHTFEDGV